MNFPRRCDHLSDEDYRLAVAEYQATRPLRLILSALWQGFLALLGGVALAIFFMLLLASVHSTLNP